MKLLDDIEVGKNIEESACPFVGSIMYKSNGLDNGVEKRIVLDGTKAYNNINSFVSPQANTFHFESFGDIDTYGELFSFVSSGNTIDGRINNGVNDDSSSQNHNFKLSVSLLKGQKIFLRVRGKEKSTVVYFILRISVDSHNHEYSYNYEKINDMKHCSYCYCGAFVTEFHCFETVGLNQRCTKCKFDTSGFVVINALPSSVRKKSN